MTSNLKFTTGFYTERTNSINDYLRDIAKYPVLSPDEQIDLVIKAKEGDMEARNTLWACNQRFVYAIAKRYNAGEKTLDLVQEGNIGLFKCIDFFKPSMGNVFLSYAVWYIKREINTFLINNGAIVKKSNKAKTNYAITKAKDKFFCENGRFPSNDEIIDIFKNEFKIDIINPEDLYDIDSISITSGMDSNDDNFSFEETSEYTSRTASYNNFETEIEREADNDFVTRILSSLKERDREIIKMAYGIGYIKAYSNQEIAEELGFTSERIRQIKKDAEKKMKMVATKIMK